MIPYRIRMQESQPPEVTIREWRNVRKGTSEVTGRWWHTHMLPMHFTQAAKFRYRHRRRTKKYEDRKVRLAAIGKVEEGGVIDNVFSGAMRRNLMAVGVVRAFPTRFTITMAGPRYITMRPYKSNQPDKAAEINTVTADEDQRLCIVADQDMTKRLNALRETKVTE